MPNTNSKRQKNGRNSNIYNKISVLTIVVLVSLVVINKINFLTKSEVIATIPVSFKEYSGNDDENFKSDEISNIEINEDEEGKKYIVFPTMVNGYYAERYRVTRKIKSTMEAPANVTQNTIITNTIINTNTSTNTNTNSNIDKIQSVTNVVNSVQSEELSFRGRKRTILTDDNIVSTEINENIINSEDTDTTEDTIDDESSDSKESNSLNENGVNVVNENIVNEDVVDDELEDTDKTNTLAENVVDASLENTTTNFLVENTIENQNSTSQDKSFSHSIETIIDDYTEYKPGDKFYLNDDEEISIGVVYDTMLLETIKLYKQELTSIVEDVNIKITGYMPAGYHINSKMESIEDMNKLKEGVVVEGEDAVDLSQTEVLLGLDLSIVDDDSNEYQPKDYGQNVNVEISSDTYLENKLSGSDVIPVHISESYEVVKDESTGKDVVQTNIVFEQIELAYQGGDTAEFYANSFSKYAILKKSTHTATSFTIEDYDDDYNYYMGKNFTDNNGVDSGTYTDNTLQKVNLVYYSYNPNKTTGDNISITCPLTFNNSMQRTGNRYTFSTPLNITSTKYIDKDASWEIKIAIPTGFNTATLNVNETLNANTSFNLSNVDYTNNVITFTGTNWRSGWRYNSDSNSTISYKEDTSTSSLKIVFDANTYTTYDYWGNPQQTYYVLNGNELNNVRNVNSFTTLEKFQRGYISSTERQTQITYTKALYKSGSSVSVELIDNPFMDRPIGYGFNGWLSTDSTANISMNADTKVQTLSINVPANVSTSDTFEIKLYPDWKEATYVFVDTSSNNTTGGLTAINPINSITRAYNVINSNFKTATKASDRELNIIVLMKGTSDIQAFGRALTLTSLADNTDYRSNATLNIGSNITLSNDFQIDFVNTEGSANYRSTNYTDYFSYRGVLINRYVVGNRMNFRIGRGMYPLNDSTYKTTFTQIIGGPTGNSDTSRSYRTVVESGKYFNIQCGATNYSAYYTTSARYTSDATLVVGNDIDRALEDNDSLKVSAQITSRTASGNVTSKTTNGYAFDMIIKSGTIGREIFDQRIYEPFIYAGIYCGGHFAASGDKGHRRLTIEGGNIANIIGGLAITSGDKDKYRTEIYVKDGYVQNIVGGAGVSTTYGNRTIQVTGGTIKYSISGASNGYAASYDDPGNLGGSTMVYVGGNAVVGADDNGDVTNDALYEVASGSVLGAGNGNADFKDTAGSAEKTHVIIDGNAIIHGNVYAGGNYGQVNLSNSYVYTYTYGYDNKSTNIISGEEYIISTGQSTGSYLYATRRNRRYTLNARTFNANNTTVGEDGLWIFERQTDGTYIIQNSYYEGNGAYVYYNNNSFALTDTGTSAVRFTAEVSGDRVGFYYLYNNTKHYFTVDTLGNHSTTATYVYLLKRVSIANLTSAPTQEELVAQVDIVDGTVKGSVFGGSNQNNINGCSKTTMKSGQVDGSIYGGSNSSGTVAQNTTIEITGGTIGNGTEEDAVFAGGLGAATVIARNATLTIRDDNENVNITGNIYGGSSQGRVKGTSTTTIYNDTSDDTGEGSKKITLSSEIFGGGKGVRGTNSVVAYNDNNTTVNVDGLDNSSTVTVYGGANANGQTTGKIRVNIGDNETTFVNEVYGGGKFADVKNTTTECYVNVYSNGTVNKAFGGGNNASIIGSKNNLQRAVTIDGGTVLDSVYGGSNNSGTLEYSHVILTNGAKAKTVYGAGYGDTTSVGSTEVSISDSTANTVYGGGYGGPVTGNTIVTIDTSSIPVVTENDTKYGGNVYGGGQGSTAIVSGNTSVSITNTTVGDSVYGGGDMGKVNGNTTVSTTGTQVTSNIYGGGNNGDVTGKGTLTIDSSSADTIYGGGKSAKIGSTDVTVKNGSTAHEIFGGGQGTTAITNSNTKVVIEGSSVTTKTVTEDDDEGNPVTKIVGGNVFGGGDAGNVTGNTSVEIRASSTIANNVYGGGDEATVGGNTVTSIKSSTITNDVFGGGNKANVSGNTTVTMETNSSANNVYGGGNDADVIGSTSVTVRTNSSASNVYGGGNNGTVGSSESNNATTTVNLNYANITQNIYGGGNKGNVYGTANVTSSGSIGNTVYGGGCAATVYATDVNINNSSIYSYVFGGGQGVTALTTTDTKVKVNSSTVNVDVYGGGDSGAVGGSTMVGLTGATILGSAYGAGNGADATVATNSYIYAEGSTNITKNLFGGGNASTTGQFTEEMLADVRSNPDQGTLNADINILRNSWSIVDIAGATIGGNVYGGANSSVIQGNAVVNIGTSAISEFYGNPVVDYIASDVDDSTSSITITNPNKKATYMKNKIDIGGTVFGGGEQMVEGKDYDFNSISVVGVIDINIDGNTYAGNQNLTIGGSIFGSGNASSASKNGKIAIKNFGTNSDIKKLISIQRASEVVVNNSQMNIHGIEDSTNKFGDVKYSLNIIDLLKLKNNSVLYLETGANRLSGYESLYDDGTVEKYNTVNIKINVFDEDDNHIYTIDGDKFKDENGNILAYLGENNKYFANEAHTSEISRDTKETIDDLISRSHKKVTESMFSNTDNRIYMNSGVNLNLATTDDEIASHPGTVKGMTFFGLYVQNGNNYFTGMYSKNHVVGSNTSFADRDFLSAYVQGIHYHKNDDLGIEEHDILKDGFYTNYENLNPDYETYEDMSGDENSVTTTYTSVITPTPSSAAYYRWYAKPGSKVFNFEFTLTASKFSTFGAKNIELSFGETYPNARINIVKQLASYRNKYYLLDKADIPNVALTEDDALKNFALEMKTGNNGWKLNGDTNFFYDPDSLEEEKATRSGTDVFEIENSDVVPTFSFYLYNSNNINQAVELGTYTITMHMEYPLDAVGNIGEATLIFKINLETKDYSDDTGYDAAITPGEQFDLFANSDTKITHKSSFSTYFSLAQDNFKNTVVTKQKNDNPTGEDDEYIYTYVKDYFIDNDDLYRVVATKDYSLPEDTGITLIDRSIADEPKYYYYNVTAQDALSKTAYRFSDFYAMGSTDPNNKYDEPSMQDIYYDEVNDYEYEKFILIFNFQNSKFKNLDDARAFETIIEKQPITIELRGRLNGIEREIFTVLDQKSEKDMYFSIYKTQTNINITGELDKEKIYLGNQATLSATTEYQLSTSPQGDVIFDTQYFDKKLGTVIKLYKKGVNNEPDELMQGSDILGLYYSLNGRDYYPRTDGTTRIKMAEKVSNVTSLISVHTENASLQSGDYYFVLQSFGSPDGIYFGTDISATSRNIEFELINDIYGLDVNIPDNQAIVDYSTGFVLTEEGRTSTDDRSLDVDITYASGLEAPFLGVSLYRRTYNNIFDTDYEKVDLADYVELSTIDEDTGEETTENLVPVTISNYEANAAMNLYEYKAFDVDEILDLVDVVTDNIDLMQKFKFKNPGNGKLVTGTYKLVYTLYDRHTVQIPVLQADETYVNVSATEYEPIGSHFTYIIIK